MQSRIFAVWMKLQDLMANDEGQDLIEYGLLISMVAIAAIAGVGHVASAVTKIFNNISTSLA